MTYNLFCLNILVIHRIGNYKHKLHMKGYPECISIKYISISTSKVFIYIRKSNYEIVCHSFIQCVCMHMQGCDWQKKRKTSLVVEILTIMQSPVYKRHMADRF